MLCYLASDSVGVEPKSAILSEIVFVASDDHYDRETVGLYVTISQSMYSICRSMTGSTLFLRSQALLGPEVKWDSLRSVSPLPGAQFEGAIAHHRLTPMARGASPVRGSIGPTTHQKPEL
jgi:hypothetical protein